MNTSKEQSHLLNNIQIEHSYSKSTTFRVSNSSVQTFAYKIEQQNLYTLLAAAQCIEHFDSFIKHQAKSVKSDSSSLFSEPNLYEQMFSDSSDDSDSS